MIQEGKVTIFVPEINSRGPLKKKVPFYNPAMETNRDISVLVCQLLADEGNKKFLDGFAATGIRGMRIAKEVDKSIEVTMNDWNDAAYKLIEKNARLNGLKNVKILKENFNSLCFTNQYDYIDMDPFGSPAPFCDSSFRAISNKGVIAVTATDTAVLCGIYPLVCKRRYGTKPLHNELMKEIGLRILLGFLVREGVKYDLGITPVLAYSMDYYFRIYIRVEKGAKKGNDSLAKMGWADKDKDGWKMEGEFPRGEWAGPLWIGKLHDGEVVEKLMGYADEKFGEKKRLKKILGIFLEEANSSPLFYLTDNMTNSLKVKQPKLSATIDALRERGFKASRTHFSPIGFKTNAEMKEIKKIFNDNEM